MGGPLRSRTVWRPDGSAAQEEDRRQRDVGALGRRLASEPTEANFRAGLETIVAGLRAERE